VEANTKIDVGRLSAKNQQWLDLVSKVKQADLTDIFKIPHDKIYSEFLSSDLQNEMQKMRADYSNTDRSFKVDHPAGGFGTPYIPASGWYSVSLYNYDGKNHSTAVTGVNEITGDQFKAVSRSFKNHMWTEAASKLPSLKAWFESSFMPYVQVGFITLLLLEPGGVIPPHHDRPLEVDEERDRYGAYSIINSFNFSVFENPGATFIHCDRRLDFKSGKCFWLNLNEIHSLVNFSNVGRIHMTVQGIYKPSFKKLIVENFAHIKPWPEYDLSK
jgi:hypothetical protein